MAWKKISKEGLDFVKKLLVKDPAKRLPLKDILQHPWLTKDIKDVRELRRNSLPGDAFAAFSLAHPDTTDLLKDMQKKQVGKDGKEDKK
jgi:serine/threonine protein kinase